MVDDGSLNKQDELEKKQIFIDSDLTIDERRMQKILRARAKSHRKNGNDVKIWM